MHSAIMLHLLSAMVWVGGMFFAYMVLRPVAVAVLEAPLRLRLWQQVFARFFPWVWLAVLTLLLTGYGLLYDRFGSMAAAPLYVHVMQGLGLVMMGIFLHVYFAPFKRLTQAVNQQNWEAGAQALGQIRQLVGLNLLLGVLLIAIAGGGRYLWG